MILFYQLILIFNKNKSGQILINISERNRNAVFVRILVS